MPTKTKKKSDKSPYIWAILRINLGLIFLWAFFDKLWGLGFTTCRDAKTNVVSVMCEKAWVEGGSPTSGFLKFGTHGPFADFYQSLAGNVFIDWLFMVGLLLIGLALLSGIGMRIATVTGSLMLFMMWTAVLPPEHHPVIDDHVVYIFVLAGLHMTNHNQKWGLRGWWVKQPLVKRSPFLE